MSEPSRTVQPPYLQKTIVTNSCLSRTCALGHQYSNPGLPYHVCVNIQCNLWGVGLEVEGESKFEVLHFTIKKQPYPGRSVGQFS